MNPLQQLAPLIPAPAISLWPLAPGWWLLALLIVLALWALVRLFKQRPKRLGKKCQASLDPLRQAALTELAGLTRPAPGNPAGPWLQQLNALLKRLCRQRYPDSDSHLLSGNAWLAFLHSHCPAAELSRRTALVEGAYQPHCLLDDNSIEGLNQAVETWIRNHV